MCIHASHGQRVCVQSCERVLDDERAQRERHDWRRQSRRHMARMACRLRWQGWGGGESPGERSRGGRGALGLGLLGGRLGVVFYGVSRACKYLVLNLRSGT